MLRKIRENGFWLMFWYGNFTEHIQIPENGVVHHLTDDSLDNRIINLSAMTKKRP
ncbi:MAG: HNH endonuclease [Anaerobutyricum sp.]